MRKAHPGLPLYVFAGYWAARSAAIAAARDPYMYKKKGDPVFPYDPPSDRKRALSGSSAGGQGGMPGRTFNEIRGRAEAL